MRKRRISAYGLAGQVGPGVEEAGGHAGVERVRREGRVAGHDGARADERALPEPHAGGPHRVHAGVRAVVHAHRLDDEVGLDDRHIDRLSGVLAAEDLRTRTPADVLAEPHVAAVEVGLRTDPGVRADDAVPVVAALEERLVPDEHRIADLERVRMEDEHPHPDLHAVAERLAQRAERHAAAARAGRGVLVAELAVELDDVLPRLRRAKVRRLLHVVCRIGLDRLNAVDRLDHPLGHARMNSFTAPATVSTCASLSSAYIGSDTTSAARRSVTGKSPWRAPGNAEASCRWT